MLVYLQVIEEGESRSRFREVYLEYRDLLYRIAFARLGQPEESEDAVHHVFVKVAEHIGRIEPVGPRTRQLVITILEHRLADLLRARSRRPEELYGHEPPVPAAPEPEGLLADCILRLPEQQRNVIWLKYHHGYTLWEIAKMLDISLASAQKIDQRAKKKLAELYTEGGGSL